MRKILGLATALAFAAALIASGVTPAAAAPSEPSAPSAAPATTTTATPTPTPTAPTATPTAVPSSSIPDLLPSSPAIGTMPPPASPLAAAFAEAVPYAAPAANDAFVGRVLTAANGYRAASGAGPLVINSVIGAGSQEWASVLNDRINAGYLDMSKVHRPDAGASILPKGFDMYSEIIAINSTPEQVVDWWMGSPAHRAALLDKRATDLGLGYVKTTQPSWYGMTVVVGNLAGYPASRLDQPEPPPVPLASAGDVAAVDGNGSLFIYPSAGGADLWQRKFVSTGWGATQQLVIADYNNDGLQDIVAVWKNGSLTVSYGQSNGTLKPQLTIGSGWAAYDIVVTPWETNRSFPSILAKQRATGDLSLYTNLDGARFASPVRIGTGWGTLTIMGADFDGDGNQDLLARNTAGQLVLYRGSGTGGFVGETRRVVGSGWSSMTHLSGISSHVGTGGQGVLARTSAGNLLHYPIVRNGWSTPAQIGTGGWETMLLGS